MSFKNYYDILGVSKIATDQEIKTAFKKLSKKFHPDKNDNDVFLNEMFKNINEAYQTLSDPQKRKKFDEQLHEISHTIPHASDDELILLHKLFKSYQLKKEQLSEKQAVYKASLDQKVSNGFNIPKYFSLFAIILFSYLLLNPQWAPVEKKATSNIIKDSIWTTYKLTHVYSELDNKSKIIGFILPNKKILSDIDTSGFVKIYFVNKDNYLVSGYLKKTDILKKNKKEVLMKEILHPKLIVNNPEKTAEIYQILIKNDNRYQIKPDDWDYLIQSKSGTTSYKYSVEKKTITAYKTIIDLNINVVESKIQSYGFTHRNSGNLYRHRYELNACYLVELQKINSSKTQLIYYYLCD